MCRIHENAVRYEIRVIWKTINNSKWLKSVVSYLGPIQRPREFILFLHFLTNQNNAEYFPKKKMFKFFFEKCCTNLTLITQ